VFSGLESPAHILIILVVAFLLFGARRLPEIGRSLGTGIREFKESISSDLPRPPLETQADEGANDNAPPRR
jgi:sec-independent protein translocase protein TatA